MSESILDTIKKLLGAAPEYTPFDADLIVHINTYIRVLNQLGVGSESFEITSNAETWSDFLGDDTALFAQVKSYLYGKVRLIFDPPTSSIVLQALKEATDENEWRIIEYADQKRREAGEDE